MFNFFSRSSIRCSSLYILLSRSVADSWELGVWSRELVVVVRPKNSEFAGRWSLVACRLLEPNSTNPSRFVGTTMSFFGILIMPRFWSSRMSIILFFFLKNMVVLD